MTHCGHGIPRRRLTVGDRDPAHRRDPSRRRRLRARRHGDRRGAARRGDPGGRLPAHVRCGRRPVRARAAVRRRDARDLLERPLPDGRRSRRARRDCRPCRSAGPCRSRCPARSRGGTRCTRRARGSRGPTRSRRRCRSPPTASRSAGPSPGHSTDPDAPFADDPGLAAIFYPGGHTRVAGRRSSRQPALARTLRAHRRRRARGVVRRRRRAMPTRPGSAAAGSPITIDGPRGARGERARADAWRPSAICTCSVVPPNSQGFVLLQILALLERLGIDPDLDGAGRRPHRARDRGGQRRSRPAPRRPRSHARAPVHPARRRTPGGAGRPGARHARGTLRPDGDTIALVTADAEGNAVSLIQSLFWGFGSGILETETGHRRAEPGRVLHARSRPSEPVRTGGAALPHADAGPDPPSGRAGGGRRARWAATSSRRSTCTRSRKTFVAGAHPGRRGRRAALGGARSRRRPRATADRRGAGRSRGRRGGARREAGDFELTEEDAFGHAHLIRANPGRVRGRLGPSSRRCRGGRLSQA